MKYYAFVFFKITFLIFLTFPSFADYMATGQFRGQSCKGWGIKVCKFINIYAVDDRSGKLFNLKKRYKRVDEFSNDHCYLYIKNNLLSPNFYTKNSSGKFIKVDIEYLLFNCKKI